MGGRAFNTLKWDDRRMLRPRGLKSAARTRGVILPLMLLVLVLLGLMAAGSSFYVHADLSSVQSASIRLQARLAAEAGLQKVMLNLRTDQTNFEAWYHNPEQYHRVIVWGPQIDKESLGGTEEFDDGRVAYRFSIVGDDPLDDEVHVRFGVTDESAKLNMNVATREQLVSLISQFATEEMNVDELADALIDWRDKDTNPGEFGAEQEYYARLEPPYAVKNRPFDTVEELLVVRGFTGQLLYGEDYDRNGLLSPNEDDGDVTFPPDDGDGKLNRGLHPYITVYSGSLNRTTENRPRVNIFGQEATVRAALSEFIDDQDKVEFIIKAAAVKPRIKSLADLLKPIKVKDENEVETDLHSPFTTDDLGWITDRLSLSSAGEVLGLININTAAPPVLATLPEITEDEIAAIMAARPKLKPEERISTAWVAGVIGPERYSAISPLICDRGIRFHVESLGYADHVGTMVRVEAIVEMRGPIAQIVYDRDITMLGTSYPIQYAEGDPKLVGYRR